MAAADMKLLIATLLVGVVVTTFASAHRTVENTPKVRDYDWPKNNKDASFKEYLVVAGRYSTLLSLLEKTGLDAAVERLAAFGVTLFAPTDDAFANVKDTLSTLSDEQVKLVLTYHLVGRYIPKDELLHLSAIEDSVAGCSWFINANNPGSAVIVQTGVTKALVHALIRMDGSIAIYALDAVLVPSKTE